MEVWWFPRLITHHSYLILATIFTISSLCLIIPLTEKLPDFSDPQMGFEARGTILAQRLTAWHNLIEATKGRELTNNPLEYYRYIENQMNQKFNLSTQSHNQLKQDIPKKKLKGKHKNKRKQLKVSLNDTSQNQVRNISEDILGDLSELKKKRRNNKIDTSQDFNSDVNVDTFFCNWPTSSYARVVIGADSEEVNLWSKEGVLAQCHIDAVLRANTHFSSLCQTETVHDGADHKCCRSWSPANYITFLSNRTSCTEVTEDDLNIVKTLLQRCAYYYYNHMLLPNCEEDVICRKHVPADCYTNDIVYNFLYYHLDIDFIPLNFSSNDTSTRSKKNSTLQSVMLFLPIAASSATLDFYKEADRKIADLTHGKFRVRGMQLGLKSTLFDRLLVSDSSLLLTGFVFVTLCIWLYTGSIILTVTTIFAIVFSLGISYAVYSHVLRIQFFPFMNLLAIVVAIGIGADDAFIYCKIWESEKRKQQRTSNDRLVHLVQRTMKHAFPSMFVTSLTTSVALFASIISNVTAINCFSLFAGITVIINFFLMITWLPACVVVAERFSSISLSPENFINKRIIHPLQLFGNKVAVKFTVILIKIVIGLRYVWILCLGALAIMCCVIVFHYPGLQLPNAIDLQLFDDKHLFEQYDLIYSQKFWFERYEIIGSEESTETLMLRFVWGVKPVDNGNYLDPHKRGTLEWDETFNITSPQSQLWLVNFCRSLRKAPFYRDTMGPLLPNCFIESLHSWMKRRCKDPFDPHIDHTPCCEVSEFPYEPHVLQRCAAEANVELYRTPYLWNRGDTFAGVKFLKEPLSFLNVTLHNTNITKVIPKIKALIVEYDSTYAYSLSFASMNEFSLQVEKWMQDQLRGAPPGMQDGWFISRLEFFELQRTLYEGTIQAIGISLALALTVLAFVTFNPIVSLYAILTIGAAIIVTVAILILLGWKLNVLESVAVSTAIGLAVDFSLHYAVSYKACIFEEKIHRVKTALQQMAGPTLMAAITSGAAGAFMLPSHVLAYIQIGVFLLLVMGISWIYATLFLCPVLAVIGPSLRFTPFRRLRYRDMVDDTESDSLRGETGRDQGTSLESTSNTSSAACEFQHENYELQTLSERPSSPS